MGRHKSIYNYIVCVYSVYITWRYEPLLFAGPICAKEFETKLFLKNIGLIMSQLVLYNSAKLWHEISNKWCFFCWDWIFPSSLDFHLWFLSPWWPEHSSFENDLCRKTSTSKSPKSDFPGSSPFIWRIHEEKNVHPSTRNTLATQLES